MISLETIEREINEIETRCDTTFRTCERLAWLYVCRDHLRARQDSNGDSVTPYMQGSEFLELASNVSYPALMRVMDEHLETIRLLYPKTYDSVLERIRELR